MKKNNLKSKSQEEIKKLEAEDKKELMILRAQVSMGTSPKNPGRIKEIKKELARIYTLKKMEEIKKHE